MTATQLNKGVDHFRLGLLFAVGSAFAFGISGPFAKSLMEAGWSPTAAVTARMAGGAVVMAVVRHHRQAGLGPRGRSRTRKTVVAYGIVPIAGAQLCYYNAVAHLSVGVALLLEYTAPILVVGWLWATTRRRPTQPDAGRRRARDRRNHVGARTSLPGAHINAIGVAWGLAAAVCAACYFMMSDEVSRRRRAG